jgi:hypothetical protein
MSEYRHQELLNSDGWQPRSTYRPSNGEYVYVRGRGYDMWNQGVAIARGGKYETSFWWDPDGNILKIDVHEWKPFPEDGVPPHKRWHDFKTDPNDQRFVRPPEQVYQPAGVDAKLTPVPRKLLLAMHGGAVLHESAWRWTKWWLTICGQQAPVNLTEGRGGILKLRKLAFIERDGVLPPGRLERWYEFNWKVTGAGQAWIAANTGEKR